MKPKIRIKIVVDIIMTLFLMLLMGYQFWGEKAHEWFGVFMFILFIFHHILNRNWHKNLFKGKYTIIRKTFLTIDVLILITMLVQMISGIIMSRYAFAFLNISKGMAIARKVHILSSYWGYVLMSFHIGLHFNKIVTIIKRKANNKLMSKVLIIIGTLFSAYGTYIFFSRNFLGNMFLKNEFVFLDYNEPKMLFYLDYIAVMWLFIFLAYGIMKVIFHKNNCVNKLK